MKKARTLALVFAAAIVAGLLAPSANAAAACVLNGTELTVTADADTGDVSLIRSGDQITLDGAPCGSATVNNTDTITVVEQVDDGGLNLHIDLSGGPFGPGATTEASGVSEIEIMFNFGTEESDYDSIEVLGSNSSDVITVGAEGGALNDDGDADVMGIGELAALRVRIQGMGGEDVLSGQGGHGTGAAADGGIDLFGGDGDDVITGTLGGDRLEGDAGADTIDGGDGDDPAPYTPWNVIGFGNSATGVTVDLAAGTASGGDAEGDTYTGVDSVFGSDFDDVFFGDDRLNFLGGDEGNDQLNGRGGDDFLQGDQGADDLDGGPGLDLFTFYGAPEPIEVDLAAGTVSGGDADGDSITSMEEVHGTDFDDVLLGDGSVNELTGNDGNDILDGRAGNDGLQGGFGDDTEIGGPGNDYFGQLTDVDGSDEIDGGEGSDYADYYGRGGVLQLSSNGVADDGSPGENDNLTGIEEFGASDSADVVQGSSAKDKILGKGGADNISGAGAGDLLNGGSDADAVSGGPGSDKLIGGDGKDKLNGGPGFDTCVVFKGDKDRVTSCERVVTKRHR